MSAAESWQEFAPPDEALAPQNEAVRQVEPNLYGPAGEGIKPFEAMELDDLEIPLDDGITQHVYGKQSVIAVVGQPNSGKTAFTIDHALHLAAGEKWFSQKVRDGGVLYVAAEAPASVIMRGKCTKARKFPGRRLPFHVMQCAPRLGAEDGSVIDTHRIVATMLSLQRAVKLVVIDTLASCLAGSDENGEGMIRLVEAAKQIAFIGDCAVMLVHHPSKGDGANLRGHGSLAAACDAVITITMDTATGIRTAELTKSRDFPTGIKFSFQLEPITLDVLDSFGDKRTTVLVRPVDAHEVPHKRPSNAPAQDKLLVELERRHRGGETAWDRATIHRAAKLIGMHRNSGPKALKGLIAGGFVTGSESRYVLKDLPEEVK